MNRDEMVDVLTAIAVGDRRTVGRTDVDFWWTVIGDLPKDLALRAVREHFRERPGVWLEPGHIMERVRAIRREELEREPDAAREARQDALEAKVAKDVAELAASKGIPGPVKFTRREANALLVKCDWCKAGIGTACTIPGSRDLLTKGGGFHPARVEAAKRNRIAA